MAANSQVAMLARLFCFCRSEPTPICCGCSSYTVASNTVLYPQKYGIHPISLFPMPRLCLKNIGVSHLKGGHKFHDSRNLGGERLVIMEE